MNKNWEIDWDYWEEQIQGFKELKKKKKLWRDHKNENREIVDSIFDWYWSGEEE